VIAALPPPSQLQGVLAEAGKLLPTGPGRARVDQLFADYSRGFEGEQRALVIALVGATGAGKSTLLNALVGAAVAAPGDQRPTTEQAVIYAPDDASLGGLSAQAASVVRYSKHAPGPWGGHVFVDTPDVNSVATAHRERAAALVEQADVAIVVLHKGSVVEAVQAEFLSGFARRRRLLFVLNHADLLSADAQRVLKEQIRAVAGERLAVPDAEVYSVSALLWQQGRAEVGEREALLAALRDLGDQAVADRVRRSNALGALRELQAVIGPALEAAEAVTERRAKLLAEGLAAARTALSEDFRARLEAASAHLGHAVRNEAARRFWGPAGWWMRLSLAGTSGVGAAALLVRGNPLVAGGVAVGSALLNRIQQHTLERSAHRRMEEVSASDPSARAAGLALAGAQNDALQRGGDAGLPEVTALAGELSKLRAEVWDSTSTLGLAEAVTRWWKVARFVLLPVVNLPLLALFGHGAYSVVRGYLEGNYVGADFLLSAAALAALIAAFGAGLASLTLFGVRRRLVSEGRRQFEAALAELSAQLLFAAREHDRGPKEAARLLLGWANGT
jgi:energy-coupling factor transporter ATP-binding protein EcfA2